MEPTDVVTIGRSDLIDPSGVTRFGASRFSRRNTGGGEAPRTFPELQVRLAELSADNGSGRARMANFLADHPYEVAFGTVRGIADHCAVSSTSLVRFAQCLGFDTFSEMRDLYRRPLRESF
jgi:hypothetical protein